MAGTTGIQAGMDTAPDYTAVAWWSGFIMGLVVAGAAAAFWHLLGSSG